MKDALKNGDSVLVSQGGNRSWFNILFTNGDKLIVKNQDINPIEINRNDIIDIFNDNTISIKINEVLIEKKDDKVIMEYNLSKQMSSRRSYAQFGNISQTLSRVTSF